jgi:hypothetical protein
MGLQSSKLQHYAPEHRAALENFSPECIADMRRAFVHDMGSENGELSSFALEVCH